MFFIAASKEMSVKAQPGVIQPGLVNMPREECPSLHCCGCHGCVFYTTRSKKEMFLLKCTLYTSG